MRCDEPLENNGVVIRLRSEQKPKTQKATKLAASETQKAPAFAEASSCLGINYPAWNAIYPSLFIFTSTLFIIFAFSSFCGFSTNRPDNKSKITTISTHRENSDLSVPHFSLQRKRLLYIISLKFLTQKFCIALHFALEICAESQNWLEPMIVSAFYYCVTLRRAGNTSAPVFGYTDFQLRGPQSTLFNKATPE